jgi:hypothetical protein
MRTRIITPLTLLLVASMAFTEPAAVAAQLQPNTGILTSDASQGFDRTSDADTPESAFYYHFRAEELGFSAAPVTIRFEFRDGYRILAVEEVAIPVGDTPKVRIPFPDASWFPLVLQLRNLRVLVFADDLLLNEFDRQTFLARGRALGADLEVLSPERLRRPADGPEKIFCDSPCGGGCGLHEDYDCDGVDNLSDNCSDNYNPSQADCDGDGLGDVCDVTDGVFQPTGPVKTCMTDKDTHFPNVYITFEHHVEQRLVDVSNCGSPDRWNRWIRKKGDCWGDPDHICCAEKLGTSIDAVGDSRLEWCGDHNFANKRNINYCH